MSHFLSSDRTIDDWESFYARTGSSYIVDFRALMEGFQPERHTHMLHSYPAKLLPQIPAFFLMSNKFASRDHEIVVADPFCGSGTVLLEGALRGLKAVGADTNPLARLIARVKTTPIRSQTIREYLATINRRVAKIRDCDLPDVVNLSEWYSPSIARELGKIREAVAEIGSRSHRDFMLICFSVCARKMSCADPRLSVPVKINPERKAKYGRHFIQLKRHLEHLRPENVLHTFNSIVEKNSAGMDSLIKALKQRPLVSIFDDARSLHTKIDTSSVDLIITSPPYVGAQKYIRSSSLSLGWLDLAYSKGLRPLERLTIGREHFDKSEIARDHDTGIERADDLTRLIRRKNPLRARIASTYLTELSSALSAMRQILKRDGQLIIITGPNTVCGYHFDTPSFVEEIAHGVGFKTQFKLIDHIRSRGLMTKRNKTAGLISSEVVLSLRHS